MNSPLSRGFLEQWLRGYSPQDVLSSITREEARRQSETEAEHKRRASGKMSLAEYTQAAWHILHPNAELKWGWALDAICLHLEAVTYGTLLDRGLMNRLLMNVPPGMMKSLMVNVFWPSWEWGPCRMPWLSYLSTAHVKDLAERDARKTKQIIESSWWQERWGRGTDADVFLVRRADDDFENNHHGTRKCLAFNGLTGGRADRVLVDDPHSTEKAESEVERLTASRIFHESLHSRVNDPNKSAIIIIMQRLHKMDVSGLALATPQGYIHLMLPMEFEEDRRCVNPIFADPRTTENELLFPERFDAAWLIREKGTIKAYGVAGQFQQRPDQREGNMFKRHWFKIVGAPPAGIRWVRYWDLAATEEKYSQASTAQTAGVLMGGGASVGFYIADSIAEFVENPGPLIKATGVTDRMRWFPYEIGAPQDPGAVGKIYKKSLALELAEFNTRFLKEGAIGSKEMRAEPMAAQAEAGNVYIVVQNPTEPLPKWAERFIERACEFPGGRKDEIDAMSGAYATLLKPPRFAAMQQRAVPETLGVQVIGR